MAMTTIQRQQQPEQQTKPTIRWKPPLCSGYATGSVSWEADPEHTTAWMLRQIPIKNWRFQLGDLDPSREAFLEQFRQDSIGPSEFWVEQEFTMEGSKYRLSSALLHAYWRYNTIVERPYSSRLALAKAEDGFKNFLVANPINAVSDHTNLLIWRPRYNAIGKRYSWFISEGRKDWPGAVIPAKINWKSMCHEDWQFVLEYYTNNAGAVYDAELFIAQPTSARDAETIGGPYYQFSQ